VKIIQKLFIWLVLEGQKTFHPFSALTQNFGNMPFPISAIFEQNYRMSNFFHVLKISHFSPSSMYF